MEIDDQAVSPPSLGEWKAGSQGLLSVTGARAVRGNRSHKTTDRIKKWIVVIKSMCQAPVFSSQSASHMERVRLPVLTPESRQPKTEMSFPFRSVCGCLLSGDMKTEFSPCLTEFIVHPCEMKGVGDGRSQRRRVTVGIRASVACGSRSGAGEACGEEQC